jgi:hypothetical protein
MISGTSHRWISIIAGCVSRVTREDMATSNKTCLQIQFWNCSIGFRYVITAHSSGKRHTKAAAFLIQMMLNQRENGDCGF